MITISLKGGEKKIDLEKATKNHLKYVVDTIRDDIEQNLLTERIVTEDFSGNYGIPKPLSEKYLKWKISHGKPRNIFQKELNLIKSVQSKKNNDYSYTIRIGGKAKQYAGYVNDKRKFFGVSKQILDKLEKEFKNLKVV